MEGYDVRKAPRRETQRMQLTLVDRYQEILDFHQIEQPDGGQEDQNGY